MRRAINDREDCEYLFEYTMSFGGFIKKRGLRIKMRNYDPYKKTILFFASLVNIVLMSLVFMYVWFHYYAATMFVATFYRKGHYAMIGLYALILFFFSTMYGSMKIGQYRRLEVMLSQYLSLFLSNMVMYFVICLLAFGIVNPMYMIAAMAVEMTLSTIWNFVIIHFYNRIFQPWKILLIYGERPAADLVYKVEARRDKYAIYDAVNIDEGIDKIAEKMKDFQAVIIGDISAEKRNDMLKYCYAHKMRAYVIPKLSDIILMGADRIHVFDTPFLLSKGYTLSFDQRLFKRALDLIIAIPMTVIASPFMLITAIAIKLYDGGPVFYKQVRCTKYEREFEIYKFRSMIVNAESDGVAKLAKENDDRITPIGKFIRATRIDELPQLFNIIKGDMSFVGPRPERPEIMKQYCEEMPEFPFRTRVKAGLTGYAQVYGKYNTTPYDKLKLDLFYIENYSLWTDIKLILMTVKTVLKKDATEGVSDNQVTAEKADDAAQRVRKKTGRNVPVLYTAHGLHFYTGAPFKNWIYYPIERYLARYTDRLILINDEDYKRAGKFPVRGKVEHTKGIGMNLSKYEKYQTDIERKDKRAIYKRFGIAEGSKIIVSVGELSKRKNHICVIEALAQLKDLDIVYLICGTGAMDQELRSSVKDLGLEKKVICAGYVKDVPDVLSECDCFVFPSFQEGLPVAVMEAMAVGLPVIASNIRGITDLIEHTKGGYLVHGFEPVDYSVKIRRMFTEKDGKSAVPRKERREQMGMWNIEKVKEFSIEVVDRQMRKIYAEVTGEPVG